MCWEGIFHDHAVQAKEIMTPFMLPACRNLWYIVSSERIHWKPVCCHGPLLSFPRRSCRVICPGLCRAADVPPGTAITVNLLDNAGKEIQRSVADGTSLSIKQGVKLEFIFSSSSPRLDDYSLRFDR
jgi:hypothetical protein